MVEEEIIVTNFNFTTLKPAGLVIKIIPQVARENLLDWMRYYFNLGIYTLLYPVRGAIEFLLIKTSLGQEYYYHCWIEQWKYGWGGDYSD